MADKPTPNQDFAQPIVIECLAYHPITRHQIVQAIAEKLNTRDFRDQDGKDLLIIKQK